MADLHSALIITRREVRDQFRDWRIILPIVILTVFFPALMNFTAAQAVSFVERYGAEVIGERLIPFLLMVVGFFPITISLVIALESFAGEKERRSLEPLLNSPLSDSQLYTGKLLAAMVPPLIASYLGISVYLVGINRQVGYFPEPELLVQILLLTAVQAVVMVSGAVVISTQTTSVRAANLLASFIIIPVALLIQGESVIMFWGQYDVLWGVIVGLALVAGLLVRTGVSHFNREDLLGREIDSLNVRWIGATLWSSFWTKHSQKGSWLLDSWRTELRALRLPTAVVSVLLLAGIGVGIILAGRFVLPLGVVDLESLDTGALQGFEALPIYSVGGVLTVWLHNLRALLLATILGVFSFAVLGMLVIMLPMGIIGYMMASFAPIGISPLLFLTAFVLPHGILEVPAIIIAGAAILRLGATLAAPAPNGTIGGAFLAALARWVRVMVLIVAPLLLGAAVLEVFLTPRVAVWLLSGLK
jgi:uncharacterized membrane protein SpoIIM required for sporulation/ABC-type transport system involved in multi-copper enzyme maturation permease subunit